MIFSDYKFLDKFSELPILEISFEERENKPVPESEMHFDNVTLFVSSCDELTADCVDGVSTGFFDILSASSVNEAGILGASIAWENPEEKESEGRQCVEDED